MIRVSFSKAVWGPLTYSSHEAEMAFAFFKVANLSSLLHLVSRSAVHACRFQLRELGTPRVRVLTPRLSNLDQYDFIPFSAPQPILAH